MVFGLKGVTSGAPTEVAGPAGFPDDQFYLLKLCLELQLEALLLAVGASAVASSSGRVGDRVVTGTSRAASSSTDLPWTTWLTEDLELTRALTRDCVEDGIPLPSTMGLPAGSESSSAVDALAARYSAMAAVVGEMIERTDPRSHPLAVARLAETLSRCEERLDQLLGQALPRGTDWWREQDEPGHYLG
jgi:hypothetical protein